MDQKKVGAFFRELRREKGLTQEQLAENFNVSARTVSRWETGSNMPDIDVLIEMSDYYNVDIRELIDGERKSENMNKETEELVLKVTDYNNIEKLRLAKIARVLQIVGLLCLIVYYVMLDLEPEEPSSLYDFISGMLLGISAGSLAVGIIFNGRYADRIHKFKMRMLGRESKEDEINE